MVERRCKGVKACADRLHALRRRRRSTSWGDVGSLGFVVGDPTRGTPGLSGLTSRPRSVWANYAGGCRVPVQTTPWFSIDTGRTRFDSANTFGFGEGDSVTLARRVHDIRLLEAQLKQWRRIRVAGVEHRRAGTTPARNCLPAQKSGRHSADMVSSAFLNEIIAMRLRAELRGARRGARAVFLRAW